MWRTIKKGSIRKIACKNHWYCFAMATITSEISNKATGKTEIWQLIIFEIHLINPLEMNLWALLEGTINTYQTRARLYLPKHLLDESNSISRISPIWLAINLPILLVIVSNGNEWIWTLVKWKSNSNWGSPWSMSFRISKDF